MIYFRLVRSSVNKDHYDIFQTCSQFCEQGPRLQKSHANRHQQQQSSTTTTTNGNDIYSTSKNKSKRNSNKPQPYQLKSNKPQSRVGYSAMQIQIDIQRWRPGGRIIEVEDHHAIKCKVLGIQIVLQCHKDIYEGGKASAGYKTWYHQEYRRVVNYLALRGHPKAQRAVVKTRELKKVWQRRRRAQAEIIGAFQRYMEAEAQERFQELD